MEYKQDDKDKILAFLKQCIKLVEDGDITNYKDTTNNYFLEFCVKAKKNEYVVQN